MYLITYLVCLLDVKSLYKHVNSLVSPARPAVGKPPSIVLSHLRGFNLHPRGRSTPTPRITRSECHLSLLTLLHTDEAANDLREQYSQ